MTGSDNSTDYQQDTSATISQDTNEARNRIEDEWYTYILGGVFEQYSWGIRIPNDADVPGEIRLKLPDITQAGTYEVYFEGHPIEGEPGVLYVTDHFNHVFAQVSLWETALVELPAQNDYELVCKVPAHSCTHVSWVSIRPAPQEQPYQHILDNHLHGNIAVVVPTYPTLDNKYLCAFVHARVKAYREANLAVDVICAYDYPNWSAYRFEDVDVLRIPLDDLSRVLDYKHYRALMLHFFDLNFAQALDSANLGDTPLFLWSHNPETQYWDWPLFASHYFEPPCQITDEQRSEFTQRDQVLARYDAMPHVTWVFITEAQRQRACELTGCHFENSVVIPNLVDDQTFTFRPKSTDLRRRVLIVRKFDNVSTYAVDIDVAAIVELSKRPCFEDMEFDIYGTGNFYDQLVEPVRKFDNVRLHQHFITRQDIAYAHQDHGIALFASRYDSQGVSMCEAAMSGLAVVASDIPAAQTFLPNDKGLLCPVEDTSAYADVIERMYNDPDYFKECGRACHEKVAQLCDRNATIASELDMLAQATGIRPLPSIDQLGDAANDFVSKIKQAMHL